jgi:hypothetical protein
LLVFREGGAFVRYRKSALNAAEMQITPLFQKDLAKLEQEK